MGSIFKPPSPPPVPVYQPPVPEPEVPKADDEAEKAREAAAAEEARQRELKRKGRKSTILTGYGGLNEEAETTKKTLLGG